METRDRLQACLGSGDASTARNMFGNGCQDAIAMIFFYLPPMYVQQLHRAEYMIVIENTMLEAWPFTRTELHAQNLHGASDFTLRTDYRWIPTRVRAPEIAAVRRTFYCCRLGIDQRASLIFVESTNDTVP